MSIVFFDVEDWEQSRMPERIGSERILSVTGRLSTETARVASDAEIISVFAWSKVDKVVLDMLPKLRHIATRSTGFDHIDMRECRERSISISNVPAYGERTVAEHTFALILAISRKIVQAERRGREGTFSREGLRGIDLDQRTLGLVGCGKIGKKVAEIAKAFAMRVVVFDPARDAELAARLQFEYAENLDKLLKMSDVISLHTPLTEATHHLINMENIASIKRGSILINTARGDLVQTAALVKALDEGILAGAGLDVLEHESLIGEEAEVLSKRAPSNQELSALLRNHILFSNPKVIVTPHNAFNSEEAVGKIFNTTLDNIDNFLHGGKLNEVDT